MPVDPPTQAQLSKQTLTTQKDSNVDDKYFLNLDCFDYCNFIQQVHYFESLDKSLEYSGVKGRLASRVGNWIKIGADQFVIDTIKNGYVIPFVANPPSMFYNNNKSALRNSEFVCQAVAELLKSGCVVQVPFKPFVVNPLSVATNSSGKNRLILDLSVLNKFIRKDKFKFEDWKIAVQYFSKGSFLFKFDLKSGYHHFDICPQQQTFLGFSWQEKFYCFTVLAFGISSAPYLFTKCLKSLVKVWRKNAINLVLYLDDGFGICSSLEEAITHSEFVKNTLNDVGFLIN